MSHTHITLPVIVVDFDTLLETIIDEERIPIVANIDKVIGFFVEDLPQAVQQPFIQQFTAFLEHICGAGDEANLIREYLGNCFVRGNDSADLLKALNALTDKALSIEKSLKYVRTWVRTVVAALMSHTLPGL